MQTSPPRKSQVQLLLFLEANLWEGRRPLGEVDDPGADSVLDGGGFDFLPAISDGDGVGVEPDQNPEAKGRRSEVLPGRSGLGLVTFWTRCCSGAGSTIAILIWDSLLPRRIIHMYTFPVPPTASSLYVLHLVLDTCPVCVCVCVFHNLKYQHNPDFSPPNLQANITSSLLVTHTHTHTCTLVWSFYPPAVSQTALIGRRCSTSTCRLLKGRGGS